jgi:hypothetical protein
MVMTVPQSTPVEQPDPDTDDVVAGILEDAAAVDAPAPTPEAWIEQWRAPGGGE